MNKKIRQAEEESDIVLVILSEHYWEDNDARAEFLYAIYASKYIIVVKQQDLDWHLLPEENWKYVSQWIEFTDQKDLEEKLTPVLLQTKKIYMEE